MKKRGRDYNNNNKKKQVFLVRLDNRGDCSEGYVQKKTDWIPGNKQTNMGENISRDSLLH